MKTKLTSHTKNCVCNLCSRFPGGWYNFSVDGTRVGRFRLKKIVSHIHLILGTDKKANHFFDVLLQGVLIFPPHQSKGYGKKMMAAAFDQAKKMSFVQMVLDVEDNNERAKSLYLKLGFKFDPDQNGFRIKSMTKKLWQK